MGLGLLLALVYITAADEWNITLTTNSSTIFSTNIDLSVTFYERDTTSVSPAPIVTMEIGTYFHTESLSAINVGIPDITRPVQIDVWANETEPALAWTLLQLTMESASHTFTFDCNCLLGIGQQTTTIFPLEDMWAVHFTTGNGLNGKADLRCILTLWESTGVSQTAQFETHFALNSIVTLNLTIPIKDPITCSLQTLSNDLWDCEKLVFDQIKTCRWFTFLCKSFKTGSITSNLESNGTMLNCGDPIDLGTTTNVIATTSPDATTTPANGAVTTTIPTTPTDGTVTTTIPTTPTDGAVTTTILTATTDGAVTTTIRTTPTDGAVTTTIPTAPTDGAVTTATTVSSTTITSSTVMTTSTTTAVAETPPVTEIHATTTENNYTQVVSRCCRCNTWHPITNMTNTQLEAIIRQLRAELLLNKMTLSSTIRRKTCALDSRPSTRAIGSLGAVILAIPVVLIVAMDIDKLYQFLQPSKT